MSGMRAFRLREEPSSATALSAGADPLAVHQLADPLGAEPRDDIDALIDGSSFDGVETSDDDARIEQAVDDTAPEPDASGSGPDDITYKERSKKDLDETYLSRTFGKDKKFSDASTELALLRPLDDVVHTTDKQRKMAARTTGALDAHVVKLDKYYEYVAGGALAASVDPEKAALTAPANQRAEHLDAWRGEAKVHADTAQVLSKELGVFEEVVNGRRKGTERSESGSLAEIEKSKAFGARIEQAFAARERVNGWALRGQESKAWVKDNIGEMGVMGWLWQHVKGSGGGKLLEVATGGLLTGEVDKVEGGREFEGGVKFGAFQKDMRAWAERAEAIKATGAIGKAQGLYLFLSQVAEVWLPQLRRLAVAVALWCTLLTTVGVLHAAPVAAAAGTIALLIAALSGTIQLGLFIWSLVRSRQLADRDARAHRVAKTEAYTEGMGVVEAAASVGTSGLVASDVHGRSLSAKEAVGSRFEHFGGGAKVDYGGVGFAHGWHLGPVPLDTLDDAGSVAGTTAKLTTNGIDNLGNNLGGGVMKDKRIAGKLARTGMELSPEVSPERRAELSDDTPSFLKKRAPSPPTHKAPPPPGPVSGLAPPAHKAPPPPDAALDPEPEAAALADPQVQDKTADYRKHAGKLRERFEKVSADAGRVAEKGDEKQGHTRHSAEASVLAALVGDLGLALADDVV